MEIFTYENNMHISAQMEEVEGEMRIIFAVVVCAITEGIYTYKFIGGDEIIDGEPADTNMHILNIIRSVNNKNSDFYGKIMN